MDNINNKINIPWYKNPVVYLPILVTIVAAIIGSSIWVPIIFPEPDFSISINPMQGVVLQGGVITTAITIEAIQGYNHPVSLSATGQPSGIVVTFIPPISGPRPSYTSTVTINVDKSVPAGDYSIVIKGTGADGKEHSCNYTLTVKPSVIPTPTPTPILTPTSTPASTFNPVNVENTFFPSGWMGDWGDVTIDNSWTENTHSKPTCIKITYSASKSQGEGWVGIYWQYPDKNWGDNPDGKDLTGATKLTFWAKGENGGEKAEFKVGGITGTYPDSIQPSISTNVIVLSNEWKQFTIDLTGKDLSHVIGGFFWATSKSQNPNGSTIYLEDILYE